MSHVSESRKQARQRLSNAFYCSRPIKQKDLKPVQLHTDSTPAQKLQWIEQTAGSLAELVLQKNVNLEDLNAYQSILEKQKQERAKKRLSRMKSINHIEFKMLLQGQDDRLKEIALELNPSRTL
jgi:hypothetical protein